MTNTPYEPGGAHDPDEPRTDADEARTDAAIQDVNAQVQWPRAQPSTPAQHAPRPPAARHGPPPASSPQAGASPSAPRPRSAWRSVGIGILGLVGGVLLALIVQDVLATAFVSDGTVPSALSAVLGFLMPVFAILGVIVAILVDNWNVKRRSKGLGQ